MIEFLSNKDLKWPHRPLQSFYKGNEKGGNIWIILWNNGWKCTLYAIENGNSAATMNFRDHLENH